MCLYILSIKTLFFVVVGSPATLALGATKRQTQAKSALAVPCAQVGVPHNDFKHHINQYILFTWHNDWIGVVAHKLHSVKPVLGY